MSNYIVEQLKDAIHWLEGEVIKEIDPARKAELQDELDENREELRRLRVLEESLKE